MKKNDEKLRPRDDLLNQRMAYLNNTCVQFPFLSSNAIETTSCYADGSVSQ
jgi:hypothetical protein